MVIKKVEKWFYILYRTRYLKGMFNPGSYHRQSTLSLNVVIHRTREQFLVTIDIKTHQKEVEVSYSIMCQLCLLEFNLV